MTSLDQKAIELKWQNLWQKDHVFTPEIDTKKPKFFVTVPYPYANSALHIGHGRTTTMADIFARFQRLNGKNVLFPMGFHISGTPVLAVADAIAKNDGKQVKITKDAVAEYIQDPKAQEQLLKTFIDPQNIASFFSSKIEETFNSVGLSIDWTKQFTTGDKEYQKFVEWQYYKLRELGIVIQGRYPILFSPAEKNAVGEDDIKEGDTDKVAVSQMVSLFFKLENQDVYLLATTLRPETVFGVTNVWLNPQIGYVQIKFQNKQFIISKAACTKFEYQQGKFEIVKTFLGKELIGKMVIAPLVNRKVQIVSASFVDADHATGVVYSVPAHAPFDYIAFVEAKKRGELAQDTPMHIIIDVFDKKTGQKIEKVKAPAQEKCEAFKVTSQTQDKELELATQEVYKEEFYGGKLNSLCGEFSGLWIKAIKDQVKSKLFSLGLALDFFETSRKAVTRSNDEVIVANLEGQWFLDYSKDETKQKAYALLESMVYQPTKMRDVQKGYLEWVQKRPCARRRGIGTHLPFDPEWIVEPLSDSTIYQMLYLIIDIIKQNKVKSESLIPEVFDFVFLGNGNISQVSKKSSISEVILNQMRQRVQYWKAFDFRYTAAPHMSNHLSFLIYHYALLFPQDCWPKNITIGGLLIKDGDKMSKSKGNVVPLIQVHKKYGVDMYRLYVALGTSYDTEMDFRDEELFQLEKKFIRIKTLLFEAKTAQKKSYDQFSQRNKWLISSFYSKVKAFFVSVNEMKIREGYIGLLYEFLSEIAYHERLCGKEQTLEVLRFIFKDYVLVLTPVIPHVCEELFENEDKTYASITAFSWEGKEKYISKQIEDIENIVRDLFSTIAQTKESKNMSSISKISIVQAHQDRFALFNVLAEQLSKTRDFKTIFGVVSKQFPQDLKFIQKFLPKTLGEGLSAFLTIAEERARIIEVQALLEEEFKAKVEIIQSSELNAAIPSKPMILLQ